MPLAAAFLPISLMSHLGPPHNGPRPSVVHRLSSLCEAFVCDIHRCTAYRKSNKKLYYYYYYHLGRPLDYLFKAVQLYLALVTSLALPCHLASVTSLDLPRHLVLANLISLAVSFVLSHLNWLSYVIWL
jgi:hypothetical protein